MQEIWTRLKQLEMNLMGIFEKICPTSIVNVAVGSKSDTQHEYNINLKCLAITNQVCENGSLE